MWWVSKGEPPNPCTYVREQFCIPCIPPSKIRWCGGQFQPETKVWWVSIRLPTGGCYKGSCDEITFLNAGFGCYSLYLWRPSTLFSLCFRCNVYVCIRIYHIQSRWLIKSWMVDKGRHFCSYAWMRLFIVACVRGNRHAHTQYSNTCTHTHTRAPHAIHTHTHTSFLILKSHVVWFHTDTLIFPYNPYIIINYIFGARTEGTHGHIYGK